MRRVSKTLIFLLIFIFGASSNLAASQMEYTVKTGDTLWDIANANKVSVEVLKNLNNLGSDRLNVGDVLIIPAGNGNNQNESLVDSKNDIYVVNSGDSLSSIAARCGITVETLMELNNLNSTLIAVGQELIIGASPGDQQTTPESNLVYIVQAGDCLEAIAQKNSLGVFELKYINKLSSDTIYPGQILTVDPALVQGVSRSGSAISGFQMLYIASQQLGVPYRYGGSSSSGFDCSGFVQYVCKQCGYELPRTASQQYRNGAPVDKSELLVGDLVFFACGGGGIDHVGIYSGDNQFIHSSSPGSGGVIYSSLSEAYYLRSYVGARRILR